MRRGFTLLEIMLALSILATITALAGSWISTAGRAGRDGRSRGEALAAWHAVSALVRDDVGFSIGRIEVASKNTSNAAAWTLTTLNRIPDESPGLHRIAYRFDADRHELWRRSDSPNGPTVIGTTNDRLVTAAFGSVRLESRDDGSLELVAIPVTADGRPADPLRLRLPGSP